MPGKLIWDATGERWFETGTKMGVLYPMDTTTPSNPYPKGVAWNGLTAVTKSPTGAELTDMWADNIKYASMRSAESFGFTIEAYMSPPEFDQCDGSATIAPGVTVGQQKRGSFGFCYRSEVGNDTQDESDDAYKLHLIYGASASPSEQAYTTINDSPEGMTLSWECSTNPVNVAGFKPTATIVIDSREADATKLAALEAILYGSSTADARLPLPDEVATLMAASAG